MVHCLHRIQGVMIPGYTTFLGVWLLTGTPSRAKIVDNFKDLNIGLDWSAFSKLDECVPFSNLLEIMRALFVLHY